MQRTVNSGWLWQIPISFSVMGKYLNAHLTVLSESKIYSVGRILLEPIDDWGGTGYISIKPTHLTRANDYSWAVDVSISYTFQLESFRRFPLIFSNKLDCYDQKEDEKY